MKQTLIAIALSATFCWSSYALAEEVEFTPEDALAIFEAPGAAVLESCQEHAAQEDVGECVKYLYDKAAAVLIAKAYEIGKASGDCATKSRENLYNF